MFILSISLLIRMVELGHHHQMSAAKTLVNEARLNTWSIFVFNI